MAEQNSYDFWTRYSNLCLKCKVCPLKSVIKNMRGTRLCCQVERIRSEHWQFLLPALSVDNSLTEVCFKSDLPSLKEQEELWKKRRKKKDDKYPCPYGYSPQNVTDICKYSARLLNKSQVLQTLIIENLPITERDAQHLAEGLNSPLLNEFALRCYPYPDEVIDIVCKGLWDSNVFKLDFSSCNLSLSGLKSIQTLIMKHKERRMVESFPDMLRNRMPTFVDKKGLSRVILNGNNIGNKGVEIIYEAISDDHWIQALDLQCCGITTEGANILLKQITSNKAMKIIDLRLNKIDVPVIEQISLQLIKNSCGKIINYPLSLWKPKSLSKALPIRKNKLKTKVSKRYSNANIVVAKKEAQYEPSLRISYEIVGTKHLKDAIVQTVVSDEVKQLRERNKTLELKILKQASASDVLAEVNEKLKLKVKKLDKGNEDLLKENCNLCQKMPTATNAGSYTIIPRNTYQEIKKILGKFNMFLKMMDDNGLWSLVTEIGLNEYEHTKVKIFATDSEMLIKNKQSPPDENSSDVPIKTSTASRPLRYCICGNPECVSNQKTGKSNHCVNQKKLLCESEKITVEKSQPKNVDKDKVTKIFKELKESYTNSETQVPPKSNSKHLLGDTPIPIPVELKYGNEIRLITTHQGLHDALVREIKNLKLICALKNINKKSGFKNVSSQPVVVESVSNKGQKVDPTSLPGNTTSSGTLPKPGNLSHGYSSIKHPLPETSSQVKDAHRNIYPDNVNNVTVSDTQDYISSDSSKKSVPIQSTLKSCSGESASYTVESSGSKPKNNLKSDSASLSNRAEGTSSKKTSSFSDESLRSEGAKSEKISSFMKQLVEVSKSYLESVDGASTDKDVMSITVTELAESIKSIDLGPLNSDKNLNPKTADESLRSEGAKSEKISSFMKQLVEVSKSYLESVDGASTDKDVMSITVTELAESIKSIDLGPLNSDKNLNPKTADESSGNPGVTNPAKSSTSSKSSKKSQKQRKKNSNQSSQKDVSSSSVPSLSDITTVSSHSLNTDSVMDQLSDSDKDKRGKVKL